MDFYTRAQQLMPWMPAALLTVYADAWKATGDPEAAVRAVRESPLYDQYFAGNRRDEGPLKGTFRFSEQAYMAAQSQYQQTIRQYGIDPTIFPDGFTKMIRGEQSVDEFKSRMDALHQGLVNNTPQVQAWFMENYGHAYNPQVMQVAPHVAMAMAMDPDVGNQVLQRRLTFAQIGGEAALRGFDVAAGHVERLAGLGVEQGQARELYSSAQQRLPGLQSLAERHRDTDSTFDLSEFEDAFLGDAEQGQRAARLQAAEASSFSGSQGRVERDQSGGLSGLRQR